MSRDEFPGFVFKMASANARSASSMAMNVPAAGEAHIILPPRMAESMGPVDGPVTPGGPLITPGP